MVTGASAIYWPAESVMILRCVALERRMPCILPPFFFKPRRSSGGTCGTNTLTVDCKESDRMDSEFSCKNTCRLTRRHPATTRMKKHRSILSVGSAGAEIKIYTLRHPNGYFSHQCAWREMGRRQTKCFAKLPAAKLFAQQKTVALANGLSDISTSSMRDIEILKSCEALAGRFNTNLVSAMEEWASAREMIPEASLGVAARFYAEITRASSSSRLRKPQSFSSERKQGRAVRKSTLEKSKRR